MTDMQELRNKALAALANDATAGSRIQRSAANAQEWEGLSIVDNHLPQLITEGRVLVIYSRFGAGKTFTLHYAQHLAFAWIAADRQRQEHLSRKYSTMRRQRNAIRDFRKLPGVRIANEDEYNDEVEHPWLYCLDEVGSEVQGASDWGGSTLELLLDTRYHLELPTIIATNLSWSPDGGDWVQRYGKRTYDRIAEWGWFATIQGGSRRREARDFAPVVPPTLPDDNRAPAASMPQSLKDRIAEDKRLAAEREMEERLKASAKPAYNDDAQGDSTPLGEGAADDPCDEDQVYTDS